MVTESFIDLFDPFRLRVKLNLLYIVNDFRYCDEMLKLDSMELVEGDREHLSFFVFQRQ